MTIIEKDQNNMEIDYSLLMEMCNTAADLAVYHAAGTVARGMCWGWGGIWIDWDRGRVCLSVLMYVYVCMYVCSPIAQRSPCFFKNSFN